MNVPGEVEPGRDRRRVPATRRETLRLVAGATLGGGLAGTAGCLGGSTDAWDSDREGTLGDWLYDPAAYRTGVQNYVVGYWEPSTFAENQGSLGDSGERVQRYHAADPETVAFTAELGGSSESGGLPYVLVSKGSFDAEPVRSTVTAEFEQVGRYDGRPLYGDGDDGYALVADGELLFVRGTTRAEAESYFGGDSRAVADGNAPLATFFDVVGVGANAGFRLGADDAGNPVLHGHAYRIDGATTTARALRVPGVDEDRGTELESYLSQVEGSLDRLRSASVEYDDEQVLLDLEFVTDRAPFGTDPLSNLGV